MRIRHKHRARYIEIFLHKSVDDMDLYNDYLYYVRLGVAMNDRFFQIVSDFSSGHLVAKFNAPKNFAFYNFKISNGLCWASFKCKTEEIAIQKANALVTAWAAFHETIYQNTLKQ